MTMDEKRPREREGDEVRLKNKQTIVSFLVAVVDMPTCRLCVDGASMCPTAANKLKKEQTWANGRIQSTSKTLGSYVLDQESCQIGAFHWLDTTSSGNLTAGEPIRDPS